MTLNADAVGVVLTLDNWLQMASPLQDEVIAAATQMAASRDPEIVEQDRRPIAFFSITDLEATLPKANSKTFLQAVRAASTPDHKGWMLANVHKGFAEPNQTGRPYPFSGDLGRYCRGGTWSKRLARYLPSATRERQIPLQPYALM